MKIYDDKWIVLTGGAGFIGSCILKVLNQKGYTNIIVVDDLGHDDKWCNLTHKKIASYLHKDQLMSWLNEPERGKEVEAIIHMGACSSTVEKDVEYLMNNNYRYSIDLAEYAQKHGIRFIYASSAATYGAGELGFDDNEDQLKKLKPLNPYGFSKHLFDLWVQDQGLLNQVTGLKFFNVFGPNEFHKKRMASVIYNLFPQVRDEGVINLFKSNDPANFKDGDQCRDFVYVKDVARIVVDLLTEEIFGLYNLGSGEANTWNSVAQAMFAAIGKEPNIEYRSMPADLEGKYQNYTKANMDRLHSKLENLEFTPLQEAISDYINHYIIPKKVF